MNQHGNTNHNSSDDDDQSDGVSPSSGAVEMADRNLLFGIVAVQMNFISREGLISAMKAWVLDKHRLLSDLLLEQN
jgi:hypothetical protein